MLKLEKIMAAINTKLDEFDIDINENDVREGFSRPSFFVQFDNTSKTDYLHGFLREINVLIYYFPTDRYRYQLEIMEMQQLVEAKLKIGFHVEDRYLKITEDIESNIIDGVLQMSFSLSFYDSTETIDTNPLMEELKFND